MAFPKCGKADSKGNKKCKAKDGRTFTMHTKATAGTKKRRSAFASKFRSMRFTKGRRYVCKRNAKGRFTSNCRKVGK